MLFFDICNILLLLNVECILGYFGKFCNELCFLGRFGYRCGGWCILECIVENCNFVNGCYFIIENII